MSIDPFLSFGPYRFLPDSLELFRDGVKVPLAPKPARALALLLARAGQVVRRDELVAALWPDEVVSYDKSLNFTMLEVRRALADRAQQPQYLETLPRLGYRFIGEIRPDHQMAKGEERTTRREGTRRVLGMAAALLVAVAGALFTAWPSPAPAPTSSARLHHVRALDLLRAADAAPAAAAGLVPRAIDHLEQAVAQDEDDATLWLALANARFRLGLAPEHLRQAAHAAERAAALDPSAPAAHLRRGDIHSLVEWNWEAARASYETAIALDPFYAEAHRHLATHYLIQGRTDLALEHSERALALEPLSSTLQGEMGWMYLYAGHYAKALDACDRALELAPDAIHARQCALYAAAWMGDAERSRQEAAAILSRATGDVAGPASVEPFTLAAFHERYLDALDDSAWDRVDRVLVLAALGRTDEALSSLEAAVADRLPQVLFRLRDPRMQVLGPEPRFRAILGRLGLPPAA